MTTATQARQPARQTHGTCRLTPASNLTLAEALNAGEAMLTIYPERGEPTNYTVLRLSDPDGRTVGFRLTRLAAYIVDRKVYDIDVTPGYGWQCDCPDAQYHNHECKHVRAVRSALAHAGITIAAPQRQQAAAPPPSEAKPALQPPSAAEDSYYCPECRRWSGSPFCDNCPI